MPQNAQCHHRFTRELVSGMLDEPRLDLAARKQDTKCVWPTAGNRNESSFGIPVTAIQSDVAS